MTGNGILSRDNNKNQLFNMLYTNNRTNPIKVCLNLICNRVILSFTNRTVQPSVRKVGVVGFRDSFVVFGNLMLTAVKNI
jgi:hypothetical protein